MGPVAEAVESTSGFRSLCCFGTARSTNVDVNSSEFFFFGTAELQRPIYSGRKSYSF